MGNAMLTMLFYLIGCAVVSGVVSTVFMLTRPIHTRDETKSWRVIGFLFVLCLAAPYGYVEVMTKLHGKELEAAIKSGYQDSGIDGPMNYYRVKTYSKDTARAIAVGTETENWGGTDRPMVAITLHKDKKGWHAESFKVVSSARKNVESMQFPPYW